MKKIILFCMFVLLVFGVAGCDKKGQSNVGKTTKDLDTIVDYYKSVTDLNITPEYVPQNSDFQFTENGVYFVERTESVEGEEYDWKYEFFVKGYEQEAECGSLQVSLENTFLLAYHIYTDGEQSDILYTLQLNENEELVIVSYDEIGLVKREININNESCTRKEANRLFVVKEDLFLLYGNNKIFFIDNHGESLSESVSPEGTFQKVMADREGNVYISMYEGEKQSASLSQIDLEAKCLLESKEIPGVGVQLGKWEDEELLVYDTNYIYIFHYKNGISRPLVNLKTANINVANIQGIFQRNGDITLLSMRGSSGKSPVNIICFSKEPKTNSMQVGKERVKIYLHAEENFLKYGDAAEMIETFNEENAEYELVVKNFGENLNLVLASQEKPDMILTSDYLAEAMIEEGYLLDLTSYINNSNRFGVEDIRSEIYNAMNKNGKIHLLPYEYSFSALAVKATQAEPGIGWTVDGFLTWIEEHPGVVSDSLASWEAILTVCLQAGIDSYVDWEQSSCCFDGKEFKQLLERTKQIHIEKDSNPWITEETDLSGKTVITQKYIKGGYEVAQVSIVFGEEATLKGYPSGDGKPVTFTSVRGLGILSTSEYKEGAFAFLEHAFCFYPEDGGGSCLYVHKDNFERGMEDAGKIIIAHTDGEPPRYMAENEAAILREAAACAVLMRSEVYDIIPLIFSEVTPYYRNEKSIDETCDVIQNRVQLYLDERGTVR